MLVFDQDPVDRTPLLLRGALELTLCIGARKLRYKVFFFHNPQVGFLPARLASGNLGTKSFHSAYEYEHGSLRTQAHAQRLRAVAAMGPSM